MRWKSYATWITAFFLVALVVIGRSQNSFNPGNIRVTHSPLILDFADQKVRVEGWAHSYAAITVKQYKGFIDFRKKRFAIIKPQNGQITLEKIKKVDFYILDSWLTLYNFKQYKGRLDASNIIELNDRTIFTVLVPRNMKVVIGGKVLKATGCKVTKLQ